MLLGRTVLVTAVLSLTGAATLRGATPLSLGLGTACVLMPEREAKVMLGVKKRHVLACAGPTGSVVRVIITRKGAVECTDAVQVGRDGSTTGIGAPCGVVASASRTVVPPVVNLSGSWRTNVDSTIGPVSCLSQVGQDGTSITIAAVCSVGEFTGSGAIDFDGLKFTSRGSAQVPIYGFCPDGAMDATITPDGQSMMGTLSCGFLTVTFSAHRE